MSFLLGLCIVAVVQAADPEGALRLDDFTIHQGRPIQREVRLELPDSLHVMSCQFDVLLPEGMTVLTNDEGGVALSADGAEATHKVISRMAGHELRVVIYTFSEQLLPRTPQGGLALLTFDADGCTPGRYLVRLTNIAFSVAGGHALRFPESACHVTVSDVPDSPLLPGNSFLP